MAGRIGLAALALAPALIQHPATALASASATDDDGAPPTLPPRISFRQLRNALSSSDGSGIDLHRLLHESRGILRVAVEGGNDRAFADLRKRALGNLCDCPTFRSSSTNNGNGAIATSFEEALLAHPKDVQQITLPDGTVRRTLASATVGFDEIDAHHDTSDSHNGAATLGLPSWVQEACGQDAYDAFEGLRDAVADVANAFVRKLDQEMELSGIGGDDKEEKARSYGGILSDANHLEHFHVYTKPQRSGGIGEDEVLHGDTLLDEEASTLEYHTDAGFFLSFVPAMDCHSYATDSSSFYLKGQKEPVAFGEDEVVIMLGAGAQYWLPEQQGKQHPFQAASHALRLLQGTHRSWYGKMHLLPTSFTLRNAALDDKSIEALTSFQLEDYDAHVPSSPVDGCGTSAFDKDSVALPHGTAVQTQRRRRMQHVKTPAGCNNQTNFFCWYQCLEIPESENAEEYVQSGYSLYCLDPGILASSGDSIPAATEPCKGGYVHNSNCIGSWQETDKNAPGYKLPYEVELDHAHGHHMPDMGDKYCYSGTSMYMDGFTWQGTTCVIYLFESWTLSSPAKFALAAIGSILLGIALEFVLFKRRSVYALSPGMHRLCLSTLIYGLQLSMGYFIMLVIMTYSGPLFISTIGGMMLGHSFFNAQDSLVNQRKEKLVKNDVDEVASACGEDVARASTLSRTEISSYQNGGVDDEVENGCCGENRKPTHRLDASEASESTKLRSAVADGATPCCQYTL